jgi:hypothetical protein
MVVYRPVYHVCTLHPVHNRPPPISTVPAAPSDFSSRFYLIVSQWFFALLLHRFASFLHLFMRLTFCFHACEMSCLTYRKTLANFYTGHFRLWSFYANIINCKKCSCPFKSHLNSTFFLCFVPWFELDFFLFVYNSLCLVPSQHRVLPH